MAAAIDLGSNSFHMIVAAVDGDSVRVVDKVRERVRIAAGLTGKRKLARAARERAIACLERFGERLQGIPAERVRAAGTNTLRQARNAREFLTDAEAALGHPIEIISGREEARLVYLGVAHDLADDSGRRLVVDIGGGSTECILGERFAAIERDSLYMGCVSYTQKFFADGAITTKAFANAELAARRELSSIEKRFTATGWHSAIGSSGTVNAIDQILRANHWSDGGINAPGLARMRAALIAQGSIDALALPGLEADRVPVIAGGVAILSAVFASLGIDTMTAAAGALREGLLYDLLGRIRHEDVRDHTIESFRATYHVDRDHADAVKQLAHNLLDQVGLGWGVDGASARDFLGWAADLHEIGLWLSYAGYQKHGAYIVANADMPGFSRDDQELLAALIRNHRRKISPDSLRGLAGMKAKAARRLCVLLRLAVCLNRSRSVELPPVTLTVKKSSFLVGFPRGWLEAHPLTSADLGDEAARLAKAGVELHYA